MSARIVPSKSSTGSKSSAASCSAVAGFTAKGEEIMNVGCAMLPALALSGHRQRAGWRRELSTHLRGRAYSCRLYPGLISPHSRHRTPREPGHNNAADNRGGSGQRRLRRRHYWCADHGRGARETAALQIQELAFDVLRSMTHLRDPRRYRAQASLFRELAAVASDSAQLRDSYLGLALQYERVARILEVRAPPAARAPADSLQARFGGPYRR